MSARADGFMAYGRAVCAYCGALGPLGQTHCSVCGAAFRLLEPMAVECGWCGISNRRDQTDECSSCGGPLPALPGGHPGPRPPDAPRALPPGYENRVKYFRNVFAMLGMIFTVCFCWTLIFPLIGLPLWIRGQRKAQRQLTALRYGFVTRGRVLSVTLDESQSINRQHPWTIAYEYDLPSFTLRGEVTTWDRANTRRSAGDVLWVVVIPSAPAESTIWPPIR